MSSPVRGVILDLGLTLVGDPRPGALARLRRERFRGRYSESEAIRLVEALREADKVLDGVGFSHFLGELAIVERALSLAGSAGRRTDPQVLLANYREAVLATYEADSDLVALRSMALERWIDRLRKVGVQLVGILSNERRWAPQIYVEQVIRLPVATFDPILTSDELGFEKPDPRAFRAILKAMDLPAEACVFVGDSLERDVLPALACGMQARLATWFAPSGGVPSGLVRELPALADLPESIRNRT